MLPNTGDAVQMVPTPTVAATGPRCAANTSSMAIARNASRAGKYILEPGMR